VLPKPIFDRIGTATHPIAARFPTLEAPVGPTSTVAQAIRSDAHQAKTAHRVSLAQDRAR
ncbi:MAG: hypothetical protein IRY99_23655, partial [Isosphaeraceae bacterium]|nr:hypothetical protein [Isosphaeraceae bacterium]